MNFGAIERPVMMFARMRLQPVCIRLCGNRILLTGRQVHKMSPAASKKLVNAPDSAVDDSLRGFVATHPNVAFLPSCCRVVVRTDFGDWKKQKGAVSLVSGGGSGHEPFAAGLVGKGLLTAAICGDVFASPPPSHISLALDAVNTQAGTIVFIINYTGDRLNFGLAIERAKRLSASGKSGPIRTVVIGEDTALTSADKSAGRRGLAGCFFVMKIAGAMADSCDHTLDSITATMGKVCENVGTIGVSLSSCSLPGRSAMFALGEEEIELGLGVHGEPGVRRVSIKSAKEVVDMMLKHMTLKDSASSINFSKEDSVAVLVNNLGGLSQLEMNIVCGEVLDWLSAAGVQVQRFYSGACMTSLEMRGVSISVLKLQSDWLRYLDAPTEATAWPAPSFPQPSEPFRMPSVQKNAPHENPDCDFERDALEIDQEAAKRFENCVRAACKALIEAEDELNELDSAAGDGDCGQTLRRSAQAIISAIERSDVPFSRPAVALHRLSSVVEEGTGGTTGGIYAILMSAAADVLVKDVSTDGWVAALSGGLEAVMKYGRAEPGDRTMVDPVHAALTVLQEAKSVDEATWSSAVEAAEKSARETATMKAKAGRASYTAQEHQTHPDPGAIAAARWLRAVLNSWYSLE